MAVLRDCPPPDCGVNDLQEIVDQLVRGLKGQSGQGWRINQRGFSSDTQYAIEVQNGGANGLAFRMRTSAGVAMVAMDDTGFFVFNGLTTIFRANSSGVILSPAGGAAGTYIFFPQFQCYMRANASTVPSGWSVVAAAKNAFVYGANVDGDLATTGGATTHTHSHSHTVSVDSDAHTHTLSINTATVTTSQPSNTDNITDDGTNQVPVGANNHTHTANHDHTGDANSDSHNHTASSGTDATSGSSLPPYYRSYLVEKS